MPKCITEFNLVDLPDTLRTIQGTAAVVRDALCAFDGDMTYVAAADQLARYVVEPLDIQIAGLNRHMAQLRAAAQVKPNEVAKTKRGKRK